MTTSLYSAAKSAVREKAQAELETQRLALDRIRQRVAELEREQQRVAERTQQVSAELENLWEAAAPRRRNPSGRRIHRAGLCDL